MVLYKKMAIISKLSVLPLLFIWSTYNVMLFLSCSINGTLWITGLGNGVTLEARYCLNLNNEGSQQTFS